MRLKLSYTVDEKDVLKEAAKLIGMSADEMQGALDLFGSVQQELQGEDEEVGNIHKSLDMLEEFRQKMLAVDTRIAEVFQIVEGYASFLTTSPAAQPATPSPTPSREPGDAPVVSSDEIAEEEE